MLVAINCRLLIPGKMDGIGWFTYHVVKQLTTQHPEIRFLLLFDRDYPKELLLSGNVEAKVLKPMARHPFLYVWWFEKSVAGALKLYKPDVFLSPDGFLSLRAEVPQVAVIHDINFEHFPEDLPFLTRHYYRWFFPRFAAKAARIATVSKFSRTDISTVYGIDPGKIDVVYNGVSERYKPLTKENILEVRNEISGGKPYFIFVGSMHPRKNIVNMLKAFDLFRSHQQQEFKFILAGHKLWWSDEMESVYRQMKFREDVIFLGRTSIEKLTQTVGAAFAMLYVSNFEGFGVPLLEAMRCGVPVITSNVTSMPEVAGNAAVLVPPSDPAAIAGAMETLATNQRKYSELSEAGIRQSAAFTWAASAERLWMCVLRAVSGL